jgi:glycine dehydrogenase subunit 1
VSGPGGRVSFLGAGAYHHYIPSVVPTLASRGEFVTAYTPYQPEASQGTLQAVFEYQSMISALLGMEVVNASHYDGATALSEAALMAYNASRGKRSKILVPSGLHPEYRQVMNTYLRAMKIQVIGPADLPRQPESRAQSGSNGRPGLEPIQQELRRLVEAADQETACVVVQSPDFFGRVADLSGVAEELHAKGVLLVVHTDPVSSGMFRPPGEWGADIVTGEGQALGLDLGYGGPYLGIFATTRNLIRRMPGRVVGATVDTEGQRGFVLTLNTREQHIRREKATSNICTNQGLMALRAAIYLAAMGPRNMQRVAGLCYDRAHYAADRIGRVPGFSIEGSDVFFKEFVVNTPVPAAELLRSLGIRGIDAGLALSRYYPDRTRQFLMAVTEMNPKTQIDRLVTALQEV